MGSCVSHCSRQDIVHQQTGRISDADNSIEISSGSALLQRNLAGFTGAIKVPQHNEVREQINAEIRALREQLIRSQVLFTYLLKNTGSDNVKSPDDKKELCTLLEGGALGDVMFHCKSYDGQVLGRLYNRSNRSSSSYTSHKSTPLHCGYSSLSCPTLPIDYPVVTKSTQTEPITNESLFMNKTKLTKARQAESNSSLNKSLPAYFSPPSTPCENISETYLLSDICEVHREPEDHSFPRHRTNSFLSAIKDGNPRLVNAIIDHSANIKQENCDILKSSKKTETTYFFPQEQVINNSSIHSVPVYEAEGKNLVDECNKECHLSDTKSPEVASRNVCDSDVIYNTHSEISIKSSEIKNENNKNIKFSQRSFRRGSGAGSPNSQLSIPRYPAFDFSEQEDVQPMFPSPLEPEANHSNKIEQLPLLGNSEDCIEVDVSKNSVDLKNANQHKRDSSKSKTLMPEFMENSETESTKGSFECEALDMPLSTESSVSVPDIAFPSLPNTFLAKLGVHKDSPLM